MSDPRRLIRACLVLCVALAACSPSDGRDVRPVSTAGLVGAAGSDPAALDPLFRQLAALESGQRREPVVIVQLGDSHTAGDVFSGRLRDRFQSRFGRAGRGMLPPGSPFPYFRPTLVEVQQSAGWQVAGSFPSPDGGLFALSGFRITGRRPDDLLVLASTEPEGFDSVSLGIVRGPGGGTLRVAVDGEEVHRLSTAGNVVQAARLDLPVPAGSRRLELRPAGDGPVSLLSWTVERSGPGVVYDSHGVVGASVNVISAWEPGTVGWELADRDPALIVLAYGTNEAFHDDLTRGEYERDFAARLSFLEIAAPGAAILVVGPPDANRLPRGCTGNGREPLDFSCAPLTPAEAAGYGDLAGSEALCRWHPPPNLEVVREVQRRIASQRGHYFWDWSAVMGGACGTHDWAAAQPPLAFPDHVHLKPDGYRRSADALFRVLMAEYDAHRSGAGGIAARP